MKRLYLFLYIYPVILSAQTFTVLGDRLVLPSDRSTSSSVVIEKNDFAHRTNLQEVLKDISGMNIVENGPYGGTSTYFIRGFGRGQVKVFLDGVELTDPTDIDRGLQLQHFSVTGLKRIEVLKGSQGALYGADASGGVILLTSDDSDSSNMYAGIASNETWSGGLYTQARQDDWRIRFNGDFVTTEGISAYNENRLSTSAEKDFYKRNALNLNVNNIKYKSGLSIKVISAKQDIDNSFTGDVINNDLSRYDHRIYSAFTEQESDSGQLKLKATIARSEIERIVQTNNFEGHIDQVHLELSWLASEKSSSVLFSDLSKDYATTSSEFKDKEQESIALGGTHYLSLGKFFSDQSVRLDKAQAYSSRISGRLGVGYNIDEKMTVKSQVATGFKTPTLYQRFSNFGGREDLKATTTESGQVSISYNSKSSQSEVIVFSNNANNLIDYNQANSSYLNLGETKAYGVELTSRQDYQRLSLTESITWMRARNKTTGADLERRPRWFSNLGALYKFNDSYEFRLSHQAVSKRNDQGKLPYYDLYNLGMSYSFGDKTIDFDLNNLFGREYESVRFYGTLGRNFKLQLRWSL